MRTLAAVTYSTALGAVVWGLFWQTFRGWLPEVAAIAIGGILGIRVATLFASATAAAVLHWRAIWIGGGCGVIAMLAQWPALPPAAAPLPLMLTPLTVSTIVTAGAARTMPHRKGLHFYDTSSFARFLHHLQGVLLFAFALPASLVWDWPRPYAAAIALSAFVQWEVWGACPVTLTENEARAREGKPPMAPESGFVPDMCARLGLKVSGEAVGVILYATGFSMCAWFAVDWLVR